MQFWRDAYYGISCGWLCSASHFRVGGNPPDFELEIAGQTKIFEVVEVLEKCRERDKEYKEKSKLGDSSTGIEHDSAEDIRISLSFLSETFKQQVDKKCKKNYPIETILVVAITHRVVGALPEAIMRELIRHSKLALGFFQEIWIWKGDAVTCVSKGDTTYLTRDGSR